MKHWVEIDAARLTHNFGALRAAAQEAEVLAVVKADAYGHGAELCAPLLAAAGARWFGVTDAAEGVRVRRALVAAGVPAKGPDAPEIVVMCGSLLQERAALVQHGLVPVVWTVEQVAALRGLQQHPVQVEIDTGMSRQGARPGLELAAVLEDVRAAGLRLQGVFTHLACAEVACSEHTERQRERFEEAMAQVVAAKMQPEVIHIANTSAVDGAWPQAEWLKVLAERAGAGMLVRTGLGLYGYALPLARDEGGSVEEAKAHLRPELLPVLAWKARVLAVRELAAGDTVGYGATFVAPRAMRVALLPVGYADGLRRELSNPSPGATGAGGWVMARVAEKLVRCAIVGRVSMNLTVCDVSGAPGMATGDEVMVLGEGITAEDHARVAGTIPYEILCGLLSVPRVLTDG